MNSSSENELARPTGQADLPSQQPARRKWLRRGRSVYQQERQAGAGPARANADVAAERSWVDRGLERPCLEISAFAPLDAVGAENYIRYGAGDPRHYGYGFEESSVPTPRAVVVLLTIAKPDGAVVLKCEALLLKRFSHVPNRHTVWVAHDATLHARLIWVWDFYRMVSYFQIQVEALPPKGKAERDWSMWLDAFQQIAVGDHVIAQVDTQSARIAQRHVLEAVTNSSA